MSGEWRLDHLTVIHGTLRLGPVDVSLGAGDALGVLGVSGSGKSTLVHTLCGFLRPTGGHVRWRDDPVERWTPHRRRIAAALQDPGVFEATSVIGNLSAVGASREQALELLDGVGLRKPPDNKTRDLSGGERRRLAIARALAAPAPRLLVLDEPGSHLDPESREIVARAVVARRGATPLLVTGHTLADVRSYGVNAALILGDGKVLAVGPIPRLLARPKSVATARRLGFGVFLPGVASEGVVHCALGTVQNVRPCGQNAPEGPGVLAFRVGDLRAVTEGVMKVRVAGHDDATAMTQLRLPDGHTIPVPGLVAADEVSLEWSPPAWIPEI